MKGGSGIPVTAYKTASRECKSSVMFGCCPTTTRFRICAKRKIARSPNRVKFGSDLLDCDETDSGDLGDHVLPNLGGKVRKAPPNDLVGSGATASVSPDDW